MSNGYATPGQVCRAIRNPLKINHLPKYSHCSCSPPIAPYSAIFGCVGENCLYRSFRHIRHITLIENIEDEDDYEMFRPYGGFVGNVK